MQALLTTTTIVNRVFHLCFPELMVIGGWDRNSRTSNVEMIQLSSNANTCKKPPNLPLGLVGMTGTLLNGGPVVCGGWDGSIRRNECYTTRGQEWVPAGFKLKNARSDAASTLLPNNTWLVMGGRGAVHDSEILVNGSFHAGPLLKAKLIDHCLAPINDSHVFIAESSYLTGEKAFILDVDSWTWTDLPDMENVRHNPACFRINGDVIVAGGDHPSYTSVEIFSLTTLEWREGANFPDKGIQLASTVPYRDTFLVVGGRDSAEKNLDTIYQFDPSTYRFVKRSERLQTARSRHVTIPVPEC